MLQWQTAVVNSRNAAPFPAAAPENGTRREFLTLAPGNSSPREKTLPGTVVATRNALRRTEKMMTPKILKNLLIAALLASAAANAADQAPILVAMEDGKTIAQFKIGDSNCRLIEGQIRCTLNTK